MRRRAATSAQPGAGRAEGRPRRRARRVVAAVAVPVAVAAVGWVVYNETFLAVGRDVPGQSLTVRAQPGVPAADVEAALAAVRTADRYLVEVLEEDPPRDVDLKLATFSRCVPYVPLPATGSAVADADELCVNTRYRAWPTARTDPTAATVLLAHERFHNVQGQTGCLPRQADHEYAWWVEGSATYVGFAAAVHAGLLTEAEAQQQLADWRSGLPVTEPLSSYEQQIGGDAQYSVAAQAVGELVERSGPGSLLAFCRAVGEGVAWETAFERAHGLSPDDFYEALG